MNKAEEFLAKCLELSERATLKEKIGIAIGEASMCWNPIPEGAFDSTNAIRVVKELEAEVFNVIDRLPKVCEALRIAMEAIETIVVDVSNLADWNPEAEEFQMVARNAQRNHQRTIRRRGWGLG